MAISHQLQRTITTCITGLCHLIIKGPERTQQLFGHDPAIIHVSPKSITAVWSLEFQCAITDFVGKIEISLPSDKLLQNIVILNIRLKEKNSKTPTPRARTVSMEGSGGTGRAAISWQGKEWKHGISYFRPTS